MGGLPQFAQQRSRGGFRLPHRETGRNLLFAFAPLRYHRGSARDTQRGAETRRPESRGDHQGAGLCGTARSRRKRPAGRQPASAGLTPGDLCRQQAEAGRIPRPAPQRTAQGGADAADGRRQRAQRQLPRILPGLPAGAGQRADEIRPLDSPHALQHGPQCGCDPRNRQKRRLRRHRADRRPRIRGGAPSRHPLCRGARRPRRLATPCSRWHPTRRTNGTRSPTW